MSDLLGTVSMITFSSHLGTAFIMTLRYLGICAQKKWRRLYPNLLLVMNTGVFFSAILFVCQVWATGDNCDQLGRLGNFFFHTASNVLQWMHCLKMAAVMPKKRVLAVVALPLLIKLGASLADEILCDSTYYDYFAYCMYNQNPDTYVAVVASDLLLDVCYMVLYAVCAKERGMSKSILGKSERDPGQAHHLSWGSEPLSKFLDLWDVVFNLGLLRIIICAVLNIAVLCLTQAVEVDYLSIMSIAAVNWFIGYTFITYEDDLVSSNTAAPKKAMSDTAQGSVTKSSHAEA